VATAYLDVEEHDLAAQALERALSLEPTHGGAQMAAGILALER